MLQQVEEIVDPEPAIEERDIGGGPSTERMQKLRELYMSHPHRICSERSVLVTESFKSTEALPPVMRQALAFEKVLSEMPIWIQEGELIVSNIASRPRGAFLFPEYDCSWIEPELDTISTRPTDPWNITAEDKMAIKGCMSYWKDRNLKALIDGITPDVIKEFSMVTAFTLVDMAKEGGIGHLAPNIQDVVEIGLNGFIERAEEHIGRLDLTLAEDRKKHQFLQAAIICDKAVIKWAGRFADLAREQAAAEQNPQRKAELEKIAEVCEWAPANPARDFRDAVQVAAMVMASVQIESNGVSIGTGRLDQFLLPYYRKDIEQGVLTVDEAVELMECMWLKFSESNRVVPEYVCMNFSGYPFWIQMPIGGKTPDGLDGTNELSYLFLEVSSNMHVAEPTVSARVHNRTPEKFLIRCGEAVKNHGGGHPAMFNDEVIIPSQLANVPNMTIEDANDYSIIGCSEIAFAGRGTEGLAYQGVSGGRMFELMLANTNIWNGQPLDDGGDMLQWQSFDDVWAAYKVQAKQFARFAFMQALPLVEGHNTYRPSPYISSITRDCIGRGKGHYEGGAIYGNATLNACYIGIATLGDSMMALKKLVFDDKVLTISQLKHALETNFEDETTSPTGPEIQSLCKRVPKYGNDVPEVDLITRECLDIIVKELRQYKTEFGAIYGTTVSPVTAHVGYGMLCGATPDGRKAGTPLSDSVSPTQGADASGPTASAKSVSNLAHGNLVQGTIYNMKMHPAAMDSKAGLRNWANLVRTYFDLGGWEMQFNIVDAETLKDAVEHPEEHRNLVVRVVGYSAFFVELDKATQIDIIARTEHSF
jgi:formate C-acetyltransferase